MHCSQQFFFEEGERVLVEGENTLVRNSAGKYGFLAKGESTIVARLDRFPRLAAKIKTLPNGGAEFIDDFANASDKVLARFEGTPSLVDSWKKMLDLNAQKVLRQNPGALDALGKPKFERPAPTSYLASDYIADHLSN